MKFRFVVLLLSCLLLTGCSIYPVVYVRDSGRGAGPIYRNQGYASNDDPQVGVIQNLSTECAVSVFLPRDFEIYRDGKWQPAGALDIPAGAISADENGAPLTIRVRPTIPGLEYRIPYRFFCPGRSDGWRNYPIHVDGRHHDTPSGFDWEINLKKWRKPPPTELGGGIFYTNTILITTYSFAQTISNENSNWVASHDNHQADSGTA